VAAAGGRDRECGPPQGGFATVTTAGSFGAGVTTQVATTATEVQLTLTPAPLLGVVTPPASGSTTTLSVIGTENQRSVAAGFDWRLSPAVTMTARVDTEFSDNTSAASGTARLRYAF
jgi:hypothetical protein